MTSSLKRSSVHRLPLVGILCLVSGVALAQSNAAWERMFAPSPQRELKRAWDECVAAMEWVVVQNGKSIEEMRTLGFGTCSEQESRLTGWMVREFGFEKGSAAVKWAKEQAIASAQRKIEARDRANNPPDLYARTDEGWEIFRAKNGCTARRLGGGVFDPTATLISKTSAGTAITFIQALGSRKQDARSLTASVDIHWRSNSERGSLSVVAPVLARKDRTIIHVTVDEKTVESLGGADVIELVGPIEGSPIVFHVWGLGGAWSQLQRCVSPH